MLDRVSCSPAAYSGTDARRAHLLDRNVLKRFGTRVKTHADANCKIALQHPESRPRALPGRAPLRAQVDVDQDGFVSYREFTRFAFELLQKLTSMRLLESEMESDQFAQSAARPSAEHGGYRLSFLLFSGSAGAAPLRRVRSSTHLDLRSEPPVWSNAAYHHRH